MKLTLHQSTDHYGIVAYGAGYVQVNDQRYSGSLIVAPNHLISDWRPQSLADLCLADFSWLREQKLEVLLLGTGSTLTFPDKSLMQPLLAEGIGVEVMDTGAACRTYNVLSAEGRRVAAALLPIR